MYPRRTCTIVAGDFATGKVEVGGDDQVQRPQLVLVQVILGYSNIGLPRPVASPARESHLRFGGVGPRAACRPKPVPLQPARRYVTPADVLAGRAEAIWAERDRKPKPRENGAERLGTNPQPSTHPRAPKCTNQPPPESRSR